MTLAARAILWLDAARPGGFRTPLPSPVGSLLYVPVSRRFREHAGFDALGVVIRPNGGELEPDAQVGRGRVIELLEEGA